MSWLNRLNEMCASDKKAASEKARREGIIRRVDDLISGRFPYYVGTKEEALRKMVISDPWILDEIPSIKNDYPRTVWQLE